MFSDNPNGSYESETYQNTPNQSLMYTMYTPTFGNGSFMIQPPSPGEIGQGFPTIPYLPLEAMIYQQQASNPSISPVNTVSGSNTGQQVISGQYTMKDSTQISRYQMGFQSTQ